MAATGWWPLKSEPQLCQSRFRHANLFSCSPSPGMVTAPYPYCSLSNPSIHGIYQARILKWVAIFFSSRAFLSIINSQSLLKLMSIVSVMPFNHLILCRPLLFPPSIFPSIRIFPNESAAATSRQSCPTLCDPLDSSPPGSPVPGILQARTLEWVAISLQGSNPYAGLWGGGQ